MTVRDLIDEALDTKGLQVAIQGLQQFAQAIAQENQNQQKAAQQKQTAPATPAPAQASVKE